MRTTTCRKTLASKWVLIIALYIMSIPNSFAQIGISNTSITPHASSVLELRSTTLGFLPPRMTSVERDAIASPATGLVIYNMTGSQLNYYNGTSWQLTSNGGSVTAVSVTTANGVSGVVATATSTPAITLTLGAITPSSVTASGTVTGSNISGTNTGNVTLAGENYLSLTGQTITANAINLSGTNVTGILAAARFPALTGDITTTAGTVATTLTAASVTNAKLANMVTKTYKGRTTAGTGVPEDVPVATLKTDLALVKADVGLANVDNTSDANKPVSTAEQTALNLKANLASPTLTGVPAAPTAALGTNTDQLATTAFVMANVATGNLPYATFSSSINQKVTSTTTSKLVTYETDEVVNLITHSTTVNPSRITIQLSGVYRITFSASITGGAADIDFWLSKNGTDVPRTNTRGHLSAVDSRMVSISYMVSAVANDYFELVQSSSNIAAGLTAYAAGTSPTRPSIPSIIVTIDKISN